MDTWLKQHQQKADFYRTTISNRTEANEIIASFLNASSGKEIYLYGAGTVGRNMVTLLQALQVPIHGIFDKNAKKIGALNGYPVLAAESAGHLGDNSKAVLIVSVNRIHFPAIRKFMLECGVHDVQIMDGHTMHMLLQSAWCMLRATGNETHISPHDCWECTLLDHQCKSLRHYLKRVKQYKEVYFTRIYAKVSLLP